MPTRFQLHCQTWKNGCGSDYCAGAMRKVFYGGDIPCDILFVGEAPGKTENMTGRPFTGEAGRKVLKPIVARSVPKTYKVGFTNMVACIPRPEGEEKIGEPDQDQIDVCRGRLEEIIEIASPRLIFAVGSVARDNLTQGYLHSVKIPPGVAVVHIVHPAWILRQTTAFQGLAIQDVCCAIRDAIHAMENPKTEEPQTHKLRGVWKPPPPPTLAEQRRRRKELEGKIQPPTHTKIEVEGSDWPPEEGSRPPHWLDSGIMGGSLQPPAEAGFDPERPNWDSDDIPF